MRWLEWGFEGLDRTDAWGDRRDGRWYVGPDETLDDADRSPARPRPRGPGPSWSGTTWTRWASPATGGTASAPPTLERVLFHLLQEYARHVGQLDIVSEISGGPVGE